MKSLQRTYWVLMEQLLPRMARLNCFVTNWPVSHPCGAGDRGKRTFWFIDKVERPHFRARLHFRAHFRALILPFLFFTGLLRVTTAAGVNDFRDPASQEREHP